MCLQRRVGIYREGSEDWSCFLAQISRGLPGKAELLPGFRKTGIACLSEMGGSE